MRKYIYISVGGTLGAIVRYLLGNLQIYNYHENILLNTFIINISGSFMLALILTVALEVWKFDESIKLGLTTGFLGAYTTFSTLCKEIVELIYQGNYFSAILYITFSTMAGLAAAYFGIVLACEVVPKFIKRMKKN